MSCDFYSVREINDWLNQTREDNVRVIKNVGLPYRHNTDKNINCTARSLEQGLVLTNNNNYLAFIATKSCKNNFCCFLSVIVVLTFNVNFKFLKLIFAVFAAVAIVWMALYIMSPSPVLLFRDVVNSMEYKPFHFSTRWKPFFSSRKGM